jgi:hypothetical protein
MSVRMGSIVAIVLICVCAILFLGLTIESDPTNNLTVHDVVLGTSNAGERVVVGVVKNSTHRSFSPIDIHIELVNSEDNVHTEIMFSWDILQAGEERNFGVAVTQEDITHIRAYVSSPQNVAQPLFFEYRDTLVRFIKG